MAAARKTYARRPPWRMDDIADILELDASGEHTGRIPGEWPAASSPIRGFDGVSMYDIAAGTASPATLYHYFPTRIPSCGPNHGHHQVDLPACGQA